MKLHNLSFLGQHRMDNLLKTHTEPCISVSRLALDTTSTNLVRKRIKKAKQVPSATVASAFIPVQLACLLRFATRQEQGETINFTVFAYIVA
ncbi:hypothetical protein [Rhizobium sp. K102]|uniref:hypothetical protein n=1 Tax=Rhizobium sp. K102 TaxID=2918527 RepID=UPI001EFBF80C|nr:hypothetical protein [Rhizobium sp. K102]ULR47574.1 hypothetical protein MHI61_32300 [Rhizobium sp. K102]